MNNMQFIQIVASNLCDQLSKYSDRAKGFLHRIVNIKNVFEFSGIVDFVDLLLASRSLKCVTNDLRGT